MGTCATAARSDLIADCTQWQGAYGVCGCPDTQSMFQLLQETAAPEDMFDDVMGQTAPAPAGVAANVATEVDTEETPQSCAAAEQHASLRPQYIAR